HSPIRHPRAHSRSKAGATIGYPRSPSCPSSPPASRPPGPRRGEGWRTQDPQDSGAVRTHPRTRLRYRRTPRRARASPSPPKRMQWLQVLWVMVFIGFSVNYMVRINMNIALVAMVSPPARRLAADAVLNGSRPRVTGTQCIAPGAAVPPPVPALYLNESAEDDGALMDQPQADEAVPGASATSWTEPDEQQRFDWNEHEQGMVLGAFFWLYWSTQVPGGVLAQRYGTKLVFGLGNLVPALLSFAIPAASRAHYGVLLFIRLVQGCIAGLTWPAMHDMTAKWIPPNERSRFVTAYLGGSVGASVTYPVCGLIIDSLGWEAVFYISGALGVLWWLAWTVLVFDSPDEHPRIASSERLYIQKALVGNVAKKKLPTPWRSILLSLPVWMNIVAQWGGLWGLLTLMTQAPSYFRNVHGWGIRMTGLLSGLPQLCRMLFAVVFSTIGDYLLKSNRMSRSNVRKMATAMCNIGQAAFVIGLAFSGCNKIAAIFFLTAATAANGAVSTGALASMVDISPNFASIILGINGVVTVLPGFISPIVVGALTYNNQTVEQWQIVFCITAAMLFVTGVAFVLFGRSEVQPWNEPVESVSDDAEDKTKLRHEL
ncbi:Vesicular glutamate transporter 2, partial [Frankliniella fusca]